MTTHPDKPQTYRRVVFADGSFVKIVHHIDPQPGVPIIARVEWLHGDGTWPLEILPAILAVWQWHADLHWKAFEQAVTLPGGKVVCWRFRPQEPCAVCLKSASSMIGKGLFDAPPSRITPDTAEDYRAAIRRAVPPEKFAATLASLPAEAQKRITGKYLTEPAVIRQVKLTTRRPKSKP